MAHNVSYLVIDRTSNYVWNDPSGSQKNSTNKKYSVHYHNSNTVARRVKIWNWRIQRQRPCMVITHSTIIPWRIHTKINRISGIRNIYIPHQPTTGTRVTHPSVHEEFQCPEMYVQELIWPIQGGTPGHSIMMVGLGHYHLRGVPTLPTHQRVCKHHIILAIEEFPHITRIPHQYFKTHPTTK